MSNMRKLINAKRNSFDGVVVMGDECVRKEVPNPTLAGFESFKPNPWLWASIHIGGQNPSNCNCSDCIHFNDKCSNHFNPLYCSQTSRFG